MWSTQEWIYRARAVDLLLAQVDSRQILGWLVFRVSLLMELFGIEAEGIRLPLIEEITLLGA